jgi:hypothetical protein
MLLPSSNRNAQLPLRSSDAPARAEMAVNANTDVKHNTFIKSILLLIVITPAAEKHI